MKKRETMQTIADELVRIYNLPVVEIFIKSAKYPVIFYQPHYEELDSAKIICSGISDLLHEMAHHLQFCTWFDGGYITGMEWQHFAYKFNPIPLHGYLFCDSLRRILISYYQTENLTDIPYPWRSEYRTVQRTLKTGDFRK